MELSSVNDKLDCSENNLYVVVSQTTHIHCFWLYDQCDNDSGSVVLCLF